MSSTAPTASAAEAPELQVTQPTPQKEPKEFLSAKDVENQGTFNEEEDNDETITYQPGSTEEPKLPTSNNDNDSNHLQNPKERASNDDSLSDDHSSVSYANSGYQRDSNDCTEFCIEFMTCFGLLAACCPNDGEGCLTNAATICGNILVGCCKC
ncbi:hypothetical protein HYPBUDRAFT_153890 [Hyphopichia burtonii NRRL Y-1933]|uniref:Uncharacterized protein n=1 Tax=Hyphopichia burtonii NRRL Y-1933 TaxID=984485 RepID=A0A1E4RES5_9ASCO|nr:hypothetical protein HYPBUDRAFT_153890 [Hyphopichia burtonii NRRL Y-1933]ODV65716.1 hypothetical protein HYPBUDRAFT_153890 [Hyphopichia burtonii NRRL Y-1933]